MSSPDKKTESKEVKEVPEVKRKQVELSDEDVALLARTHPVEKARDLLSRKHGVKTTDWIEIPSNVRRSLPTYDGTGRRPAVYEKKMNGRSFLCIPHDWSKEAPIPRNSQKMITINKMQGRG